MTKARDLANAGTALTSVSATELGYLDGVTSAVQTQIDSKIGQATAINPTIVDAKGDIIAATAADTVARLAVGSNNTVLTADSSTATGLKWAAASASAFVGCSASKSATQSIANATYTAITFNTEDYDTDSIHDNSTNTTRFTVPTGKGGKWLISGVMTFASNATGFRFVRLYKNGTAFIVPSGVAPVNGDTTQVAVSYIHTFAAGDYMEVFVYQNSGGNLNVAGADTNIQFTYLGA